MADAYGAFTLPAPIPVAGVQILDPSIVRVIDQRITDPMLYFLGTYLAAVANAEVGDAWRAIEPRSTSGPCMSLYFNDPGKIPDRSAADLPAFYLYRRSIGAPRQIASGFQERISRVVLRYVFDPEQEEPQRDRLQLVTQIDNAICARWRMQDFGRHPAWVVPGDLSRGAAGTIVNGVQVRGPRGSLLRTYAGYRHITIGEFNADDVTIKLDAGTSTTFEAYGLAFDVAEGPNLDNTRWHPPLKGLTSTMSTRPTDPLGPAVVVTISES